MTWTRDLPPMPDADRPKTWWWFYGTTDEDRRFGEAPGVSMVEVWRCGGDRPFSLFVAGGASVYPQNEGWEGWWHPVEVPALPAGEGGA